MDDLSEVRSDPGEDTVCPPPAEPFVKVVEDGFGFCQNEDGVNEIVRRFTFTNQNGLVIQVITYGAAITSIKYPDKYGQTDDVVLGFDTMEGYLSPVNPYFGAIIGRVANRIAKGHFKIGNEDFQLSTNEGEHHLHGGFKGFDKANWKATMEGNKVVMTHISKDGEEGYPGEVLVYISYELSTQNEFTLEMKATCSKATPINLTNHTYFNLGGHNKGAESLYQHIFTINADRFCHTDEDFIPSGMLKNVVNSLWDFRIGRKLGDVISKIPYGGYDQNMCIHKTTNECLAFVARVVHPKTARTLEIYSNQPGVQFYTSNEFPLKSLITGVPDKTEIVTDGCQVMKCPVCGQLIRDPDFELADSAEPDHTGQNIVIEEDVEEIQRLFGKDDAEYFRHAAFCLMTQKYPDSVHRKNFPNSIIKPGECYYHIVKYIFDLYDDYEGSEIEDEGVIREVEGEGGEEYEEEKVIPDVESKTDANVDDLLGTKLEENGR